MSMMKVQSSSDESLAESMEFNFKSLSLSNAYQNTSLSCSSDQSSPCLTQQDQSNDLSATKDHGIPSSFQKGQNCDGIVPGSLVEGCCNKVPGSTGNMISDDDSCNQDPNISAGRADDGNDVAEPIMSGGPSSNNDVQSVGVTSIPGQQEDISSGSNLSASDLSVNREVLGGSRQIFETGNNLANNLSFHSNASSSHTLPISPGSLSHVNIQEHPVLRTGVGLHASSHSRPHLSTRFHPERPQGNFNPGLELRSQYNPMLFNPHATAYYPLHFDFGSSQSFLPMGRNDVYVDSSTPNMSNMVFVPNDSRNLPLLPSPINSNLRAGASAEGRLLSHHPQHHGLGVGRYGALDGASNHQVDYYSGFQQGSSLPWALPCTNQAGGQQAQLSYPPWFLSPWNVHGLGSGDWNIGFVPSPYPGTYEHLSSSDMMLQSGHSNLGPNPYFSGSLISHYGHHRRSLGVPHTSQSMEAVTEREQRLNSEFRQAVIDAHHMENLLAQFHLPVIDAHHMENLQNQPLLMNPGYPPHLNAYGFPEETLFDRYINMRLEADQMSYEELLLLGEQIGSVKTGLSEETIMELLKQKHYECDISDPPLDAETCCICRGEYVHGEEIGVLNCGHEFHTECIKLWLVIKNNCPVCKRKGLGV